MGPLCFSALFLRAICSLAAPALPDNFYTEKIQPLLQTHCYKCHSQQSQALKGELRLDDPAALRRGGASGPVLVPGKAAESLLIRAVQHEEADLRMPPKEKLSGEAIADLVAWIEAGAPFPATLPSGSASLKEGGHWAFARMKNPSPPPVKNRRWVKTPIDSFLLSQWEKQGLEPAPPADPATWLRRVTLDLTGLPPAPEELDAITRDSSPAARIRAVDRLLSSAAYGERWARHWLDLVRYAESNGYERDAGRTNAWRYRDYVIDSFNRDKPYDQFLTEQIAGDELENASSHTQIATTFLRLGTWDDEPADHLLDRYEQLDDVLGTTSAVFMAQTLRCARCHDHKFEPFSQKDYYRVLALFEPLKRPEKIVSPTHRAEYELHTGTREELDSYQKALEAHRSAKETLDMQLHQLLLPAIEKWIAEKKEGFSAELLEAFKSEPSKRSEAQKEQVLKDGKKLLEALIKQSDPKVGNQAELLQKEIAALKNNAPKEPPLGYIWYEDSPEAPATRLLERGVPTAQGPEVQPAIPAIFSYRPQSPAQPLKKSTGRRLWFARWLASPEHPLTARVIVNRIWQWHFGEGLVSTENDFGVMGAEPSHPELLDWLAQDLIRSGWSLKHLHRQIVLSSTYGQGSLPETLEGAAPSPWRGWTPRRLEAETIRDSVLKISGQLTWRQGGPGVFPEIPSAVLNTRDDPSKAWGTSPPDQQNRRSIYIFAKRSIAVPELELLDAPSSTASCEQRVVSTTGPQALTFLNGPFMHQQAGHFARRLIQTCPEPQERIRHAFQSVLGRGISLVEFTEARKFLAAAQKQIVSDHPGLRPEEVEQQTYASFCLVLLNSNEFFYLN